MSFEKAGNFLLVAAQKYKLKDQVKASIIHERVKGVLKIHFTKFADLWVPQKFEGGVLSIAAKGATASSALFLRTHELLELLDELEMPEVVREIRIVRQEEKNSEWGP